MGYNNGAGGFQPGVENAHAFFPKGSVAYRGDFVESAGIGAFFAFWLGSGFGVLVSGVWWDSKLRAAGEH